MLFLTRDTMRDHPVGFEKERRNIFDPEEDQLAEQEPEPEPELSNGKDEKSDADADSSKEAGAAKNGTVTTEGGEVNGEESKPIDSSPSRCARVGCSRKPRFDSRFCSDSCGVSALEMDLLHSFQESSDIHPSVLRN